MVPYENLVEFKKLYGEFYSNVADAKYERDISPFFMQIGKRYGEAGKKCLFVGKSVNGWITESRDVEELFHGSDYARIANRQDEIVWVEEHSGNTAGYNTNNSAFWRVIKNVAKKFCGDEWYDFIAWSNIYKFSPQGGGNPPADLRALQRDIYPKILDMELDYLKPDFVIFLASGWEEDYIRHTGLSKDNGEYVEWGNKRKYRTYHQKHNGIVYIQSPHPQGKSESAHADAIVKIIGSESFKSFNDACSQYLDRVTEVRISMEKMIAVSKSDGSSDSKNADYEAAKKSFEENCKNASEAYQKFMLVCRRDERR